MTAPIPPLRYEPCMGCDESIPRALVACHKCWFRLPNELRNKIMKCKFGSINRMRAIGNARIWLKENRTA